MDRTYRIINGGKVDTITVPGVRIMADYKISEYYVEESFGLTPLGAVNYIITNYLSEEVEEETVPKTVSINITPEFNDYTYDETKVELDKIFEFKAYAELALTSCYDYCEFEKDSTVAGIELSGDNTGFLFKSKYFNSANKFDNYRTLVGLVSERFITLKGKYFNWSLRQILLNSIDVSSYNFFIMPPK